jgi:hypothetical protein
MNATLLNHDIQQMKMTTFQMPDYSECSLSALCKKTDKTSDILLPLSQASSAAFRILVLLISAWAYI